MMGGPENFNPVEKEELKRRTFSMLLYLLRSPFYDRFSKYADFCITKVLIGLDLNDK